MAKSKIAQFVDGERFILLYNVINREIGAPRRKDYAVSIEFAKHIAMMEHTERGTQVRDYFIEC